MSPTLEIEEIPDGLVIRAVRKGSLFLALIGAAVAGAVVFLLGQLYFHRPALLVITVLAAAWGSSRWWRAVRAEMRITNVEVHAVGHSRIGYRFDCRVPVAEIRRIEYRAPQRRGKGDENKSDAPGGLYVRQKWKADCALPLLNEAQAQEAIAAIHRRFPAIPVLAEPGEPERPSRDLGPLHLNLPGGAGAGSKS